MASSSNIGLLQLPWGKLPRSPVSAGAKGKSTRNPLEMSFRDIMDEQQKESSQEREFEKYIEDSYVTVITPPASPIPQEENDSGIGGDLDKSFLQLEDLDTDLKLVMSFYEEQDFDDAIYELSEKEIDELEDDDSDKYYEGLAKKLSTMVEIQNPSVPTSTTVGVASKVSKSTKTKNLLSLQDHVRTPSSSQSRDNFVDSESKVSLDKLKQKGLLKGTFKPIHVGNSATILFATGGMLKRRDDTIPSTNTTTILKLRLPKECTIKVFKNNEISKTDAQAAPVEEQRLVEAKKEMTYLNRMTRAGIPCAQVQFVHKHILVTEFLGKDGVPAKKLKDAQDLTNNRSILKLAYEQVTTNMKSLYKTCHLVHGNLSENNILWHKRQPYFTNLTSAINSNRPEALEMLFRDCVTITDFFESKKKPDCRSPQELFHWITGVDYSGQSMDCATEQDFAIV